MEAKGIGEQVMQAQPIEEIEPDMSDYPYTVTSEEQLIELLLQSLNNPAAGQVVTDETWEQRKAEVRRRLAKRSEDTRE